MPASYDGPLRDEPLAVELHNTRYATGAGPVDAFADRRQAQAWLDELAPRLPDTSGLPGPAATVEELRPLRDAVRSALHAVVQGTPQDPVALETINAASRRAPRSPRVDAQRDGALTRATDTHGATRADAIVAAFARDAIELLTSPHREHLRACGAPGCVLLFLKHHPRREWCSDACGNRARQARHYRRKREQTT